MHRPTKRSAWFHIADPDTAPCGIPWEIASEICLREARRMGLSEADAQDAAQEALVRSWRARQSFNGSAPHPWLSTIARNEAIRLWRRTPGAPGTLDERDHIVGDGAEQAALRVDVGRATQELSHVDRKIVEMRYRFDMTHVRIAETLGMPVGTVKVRLHRVRARLRDHLETGQD